MSWCGASSILIQWYFVFATSDPDLVHEKCLERDEGFETALDHFPKGYKPGILQPEMSGAFNFIFIFFYTFSIQFVYLCYDVSLTCRMFSSMFTAVMVILGNNRPSFLSRVTWLTEFQSNLDDFSLLFLKLLPSFYLPIEKVYFL